MQKSKNWSSCPAITNNSFINNEAVPLGRLFLSLSLPEQIRLPLPAQRIVPPQLLEEFRVCFQRVAVAAGVIHLQVGFRLGGGGDDRVERLGRRDVEVGLQAEEAAEGGQRHAGGIGLAVGGIARDVGRADESLLQQRAVNVRLVLPHVDDGVQDFPALQGVQQGRRVGHFAARGVDEDGLAA